ncbi:MAG: hypothetical protein LBD37_02900 [Treponema sp.]|jgi:hypothetical protein|nr:hypothetical protein [Treponema sp.]
MLLIIRRKFVNGNAAITGFVQQTFVYSRVKSSPDVSLPRAVFEGFGIEPYDDVHISSTPQ